MAKLLISGNAEALLALFTTLAGRNDVIAEIVDSNGPTTQPRRVPTIADPADDDDVQDRPARRRTAPRQSRVEYHATRKGRGSNFHIGPKARRVLDRIIAKPSGLGELQRYFGEQTGARFIKPKTVDGSVTILKENGLIDVYDVTE